MQVIGVAVGIVLVLVFVLAVCALLTALSGWSDLAERFAASKSIDGTRFRFGTVTMGRGLSTAAFLNHNFVTIGVNGLYLSTLLPIGPPLLIPWTEIESMEPQRGLLSSGCLITIRNFKPQITLYGEPGRNAREAFEHALSVSAP